MKNLQTVLHSNCTIYIPDFFISSVILVLFCSFDNSHPNGYEVSCPLLIPFPSTGETIYYKFVYFCIVKYFLRTEMYKRSYIPVLKSDLLDLGILPYVFHILSFIIFCALRWASYLINGYPSIS